MPLASYFRRNGRHAAVHASYAGIVARAREPLFFAAWGVPDTLDGRFEVLALHAFLVLNRLKTDHAATAAHAQALFDAMFADLDRGLREMGVGDLSVGRQVKAMARGFYGRIVAYGQGLGGDDATLRAALRRNLFGTVTPAEGQIDAAAAYVRRQAAALAAVPVERLLAGEVPFAAAEA
jgi:cytochrome b pre-mRNA-processing protein 3